MTTTDPQDAPTDEAPPPQTSQPSGLVRTLGILVIVAGVVFMIAGVVTWIVVQTQLADEEITVSEDADRFAGDSVDGPLTAYAEADVIEEHALAESDGLTYAELDREDPRRESVMTASFLRSSLFTSVVSFGVALMAFGLGIVLVLIGIALLRLAHQVRRTVVAAST